MITAINPIKFPVRHLGHLVFLQGGPPRSLQRPAVGIQDFCSVQLATDHAVVAVEGFEDNPSGRSIRCSASHLQADVP